MKRFVSSSVHFLSMPFVTGHLSSASSALPASYPESCKTSNAFIVVSSRLADMQPSSSHMPWNAEIDRAAVRYINRSLSM